MSMDNREGSVPSRSSIGQIPRRTFASVGDYIAECHRCIDSIDEKRVSQAIDMLFEAYRANRQIFIFGNGGSAATSSLMAHNLREVALNSTDKPVIVTSLVDNAVAITGIGNDFGFDNIFAMQLEHMAKTDDVFVAISGSGNSPNVVKAVEYAKLCGAKTIGILGFKTGGKVGEMVDCPIIMGSNDYGPIEDIHFFLTNVIVDGFKTRVEEQIMRKGEK